MTDEDKRICDRCRGESALAGTACCYVPMLDGVGFIPCPNCGGYGYLGGDNPT